MEHKAYFRSVPGSTTAMLMIHGIMGTPNHFRDFLSLVPEDWTVYNILLEGHGGDADDFSAASMKKWKAQVDGYLQELFQTHDQVVILAHSMGTLFAFQAAVRYPDKITGLFLLGTPLRVHLPISTAMDSLRLSFGCVNENSRSAVDMRDGCSVRTDWRIWKSIFWVPRFLELFQEIYRTHKILPQLTVPCQVFQSGKDELVSNASCRYVSNHPSIRFTFLPESGHFGYYGADRELLFSRFREMIESLQ